MRMQPECTTTFQGIQEDDRFLSLFPHRFDYIWAEHPDVGAKPEWRTESRHPLSDRLIQQGGHLYGVRFGSETRYAMLDIDAGSAYHPKRDPFAISRIAAALEPIGLVRYVGCTSSYSGGLHLYFPFPQSQSSWKVAIALSSLLENAGFKPQPGQLEVFPNPKPFAIDGAYSLFNAHRLPLQIGSYLVNANWQPIWTDEQIFLKQWEFAESQNDLDRPTLQRVLKQAKRRQYGITGKAAKFLNDLNAEIEMGWTGRGQTNRLLGRITMRSYIFHHVLSGGDPLIGQALADEIIRTARSLPGYEEWCQHQHEIEHRAEEWARCIENSRYFHFGYQTLKLNSQTSELMEAIDQAPSWNQQQSASARERIKWAIADLLEKESLPARPTARFQALLKYGIGGGSLYRHRDLWHPNYFDLQFDQQESQQTELDKSNELDKSTEIQPVEIPPHPPIFNQNSPLDYLGETSNGLNSPSLFPEDGGNGNQGETFTDRTALKKRSSDSNVPIESFIDLPADPSVDLQMQGLNYIRQVLNQTKAHQDAYEQAKRLAQAQHHRIRSEAHQHQQIQRMRQYLTSGDPILTAEAKAWMEINPGLVDVESIRDPG
ncbi:hypothetical protein [Leptolyngbya ohadii]|uniref:hypothetical protein n=1 Tax=Leptolyngbya ohadii TaxID=1962290 RepID=UPI00117A9486